MAHRSQCSSAGDNPLDPNYLPTHYREEYRLAVDALVEEDREGYCRFLQDNDVVDFLCSPEIKYIQRSVQVPSDGNYGNQQRCLQDTEEDSSSDTYWPVHSDLDAPDLDLGWPQLNRFVGPTEVTTLVNPAEFDMPSIKEQARRLIRNAQQVVAIVMDMFTDVDIFAEVLDAAMRNVAVYILLDEQNAHHFVNMLSNCRVNLEMIQYLRVRTVSGISYQCRSGKMLKGQMMDRFLLTDCRAVLSGNYSFMWSFEKLHRCLAHLFLGQLVSTFDEEFRILFAQSQPLTIDNLPPPMEDFVPLPERQYLMDRAASFREARKYATVDNPCPDEWPRHPFDEKIDTDRKKLPHNRHESPHRSLDPQGAVDMYKYPAQQSRVGQTYDQNSRMPFNMMESPNFKRHSYAEGNPGRQTPYQPMWQPGNQPNPESQGGPFHRSHHAPPRAGVDAGYSAYDKFRGLAYPSVDQNPDPGLPHEMEQPETFDLVHNYLSSTSNVDMDQIPDKFNPPAELSSGSFRPRRLSTGQPHACETAPSLSSPAEETTQILPASNTNRKDPAVRQGLRNYRINSYLSTCDDAGDEDMPLPPHQASDPFEETPNPSYNSVSGPDLLTTKFPNRKDFVTLAAQAKITPSTSESSLTEADKTDETEQQEPKDVRPEESFRRRYNATVQRSSRLRSSLIFSSQLEQPVSQDVRTTKGEQDDKAEGTQSKLPFAFQVLGQRKTIAKEPFEWSRYVKEATGSLTEPSKEGELENKEGVENITDNQKNTDIVAASKPIDITLLRQSTSQCELSKIDQPMRFSESLLDMSDADNRLMFFKQLAAKRKAEKVAAPAKGNTAKVVLNTQTDLKNTTGKIEQPAPSVVGASCVNEQSSVTTDSEKLELKKSKSQVSTSITDPSNSQPLKDPSLKEEPESSSPGLSYAEQLASSKSAHLEINTSSPPNSSESSAAHSPVGVEPSLSLSTPLEPSSSEQIQSDVDASKNITVYPTQPLIVREPFKWNRNVRSAIFDSTIKKPLKAYTVEEETHNSSGVKHPTNSDSKATSKATEVEQVIPHFVLRPSTSEIELSKTDQPVLHPQSLLGEPTVDMNDADMRLLVFRELAAKRKAEKAAAAKDPATVSLKTHSDADGATGCSKKGEPTLCKTALEKNVTKYIAQLTPTESPTVDNDYVQSKTIVQKKQSQNPVPMASCENEQSSVTMDSEKSQLKKSQHQVSTSKPDPSQSTLPSPPLKDPNLLKPSVKEGSQFPPSTIEHSEPSHVTSSTESTPRSANELETLKHDSFSKESSVSDSSSAEQPAFPKSTPLEMTTFSTCLSQPLSTTAPSTTLESNPTDNKTADTTAPAESLLPPSLESSKTSSQTPEAATQPVVSPDMETMKPKSIGVPSEIPATLESGVAESNTSSKASESHSKPYSFQAPIKKLPQEPCSHPTSSKMELPKTESNSVALESSSFTAVLPAQEDVEDKTDASLRTRLSPPCSVDPTTHSESLICNIEKEPVVSTKLNASETTSEEIQIEKTSASNPDVPPSILALTQPVPPSSSTLGPDSDGSVVLSKPETMAKSMPPMPTLSEVSSSPKLSSPDCSKESPIPFELESLSDNPTKPTLEVSLNQTSDQTKPSVACEIEYITSENCPPEPKVTTEKSNVCKVTNKHGQPDTTVESKTSEAKSTDTITKTILQDSACPGKQSDQSKSASSEKVSITSSEESVPLSPHSKQPKVNQSRYHSSTANVISSSNLRDDTKLLLGQISANSQSRNEPAKELPVTDDDKESKADKNDKGRYKCREAKTAEEREVLLQKIQSMRKANKVYSRFEFVVLLFWMIFAYDRELVYPATIDAFFPPWMNHAMHTFVFPILLGEFLVQPHTYPKTLHGLAVLGVVGLSYLSWVIWVYLSVGVWVYPLLGLFSNGGLVGLFLFNMSMATLLYLLGEKLNCCVWGKLNDNAMTKRKRL
ncbi:hypothetical protein NHX12_022910 [Muraenolepis orangiensis]|uniref:Scaffolding anchor of CK1 domain-containing protein n=1 Tax=Muraenolepis orangiensis TaxID=630683 RepID=A0A9Q0EPC9_9TELE|nr:hypothetical protein NHX12_022910 [Muraenolepis orangiensis]